MCAQKLNCIVVVVAFCCSTILTVHIGLVQNRDVVLVIKKSNKKEIRGYTIRFGCQIQTGGSAAAAHKC